MPIDNRAVFSFDRERLINKNGSIVDPRLSFKTSPGGGGHYGARQFATPRGNLGYRGTGWQHAKSIAGGEGRRQQCRF